MDCILANGSVYRDSKLVRADVRISNGCIAQIADRILPQVGVPVFDFSNCVILPGLIDVHVHLREPGFCYKETIATGTAAAAAGGFTTVCAMPNLSPAPDCMEHLAVEMEAIRKTALVHVFPYATITRGEQGEQLSDMEGIAPFVVAFSDDGKGVQDSELMRRAMTEARRLDKLIVAHCEDESLLRGGCIHQGEYAGQHGYLGICSESEWHQVERDLLLAEQTGCRYHVCHVSTRESVQLIRRAKARGVDVSCETAPHYLLLNDMNLQESGRFKMNPPIRSEEDRQALLEGILDGTVDMIATDHAPHTAAEKSRGLQDSLMGVSGLETAFPVLYTGLVKTGILSLEQLAGLMHDAPARRFGIGSDLEPGNPADLTVFALNTSYQISPGDFFSKGKATPFEGWKVQGKCLMTMVGGNVVYRHTAVPRAAD